MDANAEVLKFARIRSMEIAKPGTWNDIEVTTEMLDRLIAGYDPVNFSASLTFGHPATDNPPYATPSEGRITRIYWRDGVAGSVLCADLEDVSWWAADQIDAGAFMYPSVVVDTGWTQLYQIGMLGATEPGMKGLKRMKEAYIEFSGNSNVQAITCETEEMMPGNKPEDNKPEDTKPENNPLFAFFLSGLEKLGFKVKRAGGEILIDDSVEREREEFAAKLAAAQEENKRLKAEREAEASKTRFAQALAKVDALIGESKLTPAVKDAGLVEVFAALMADERKLKFAASDGAEHESTVAEMLEASLSALTPHELKKKFSEDEPPAPPTTGEERADAFEKACIAFAKENKREPNAAELREITKSIFTPEGGK